jgi:ribosomal-protein-serine acetyltransferase
MIIPCDGIALVRHAMPDSDIQEILNDPQILENLSESRSYPGPMPAEICFRITKDGETIGQVCIKNIKWINRKAEIGFFVRRDMQGKGYGTSALKAIINYGFRRLNLYRLEAELIDGNEASMKMLLKEGFREEGRLREAKFINGRYRDLIRFGLLEKEYAG